MVQMVQLMIVFRYLHAPILFHIVFSVVHEVLGQRYACPHLILAIVTAVMILIMEKFKRRMI